jgi:hypothetical protein
MGNNKLIVGNVLKWLKILFMIAMPFIAVLLFTVLLVISLFVTRVSGIFKILLCIVYIGSPIVSFLYLKQFLTKNKVIFGILYFVLSYLLLIWLFVSIINGSGLGDL